MDISTKEIKNQPATKTGKPKTEKRRNNEKRKEKSRDAARTRRAQESDIFNDMATELPLKKEDIDHLDKASIMRLSIVMCKIAKLRNEHIVPNIKQDPLIVKDEDTKVSLAHFADKEQIALKSIDGFLLILSGAGEITFVSANIADYLGLAQVDLLGQPIWDYCHQCDHEELRDALNGRHLSISEVQNGAKDKDCHPQERRDFFLRLKCTLTSRGRSVNIKSASYKVIHITGHITCIGNEKDNQPMTHLISIGCPLPHPSNIEFPLGTNTFLTKHGLDMKFSYVDDKMLTLLGYSPEHLISKPLYHLHHGEDTVKLVKLFKDLFKKGQIQTNSYRFLARFGGYAWVVTQATMCYEKQKPSSIVCVNYVISGIENEDEILSCEQLEASKERNQQAPARINNNENSETNKQQENVVGLRKVKAINSNTNGCKPAPLTAITVDSDNCVAAVVNNQPIKTEIDEEKTASDVPVPVISKNVGAESLVDKENCRTVPRSVTASIFAKVHPATEVDKERVKCEAEPLRATSQAAAAVALSKRCTSSTKSIFNRPQPATAKIFVPRTEDMNKGFLTFTDDESLPMLKDEPEDLTHLAPTAGDACIPLEDTELFSPDMFDMFDDSYRSLLPEDDIHSLGDAGVPDDIEQKSIVPSLSNSSLIAGQKGVGFVAGANSHFNHNSNSSINDSLREGGSPASSCGSNSSSASSNSSTSSLSDPFINYRDESNETIHSPHLLSPSGLEKSPDAHSMPSLCSPDGSLPDDELAFNLTLNMDDEMDLRAPYISMSEHDDLPLLISDDLMWGAHPESVNTMAKVLKQSGTSSKHQLSQLAPANTQSSAVTTATTVQPQPNHQSMDSAKQTIDSSLAALLCGTVVQQQHQQVPQQVSQLGSQQTALLLKAVADHKKASLDVDDEADVEHIVNPLDVMGRTHKTIGSSGTTQTNVVDAWTLNEFLKLNNSSNSPLQARSGNQTTTMIKISPMLAANPSALTMNALKKVTVSPLSQSQATQHSNKRPGVVIASETNKRARCSTTSSPSAAVTFVPVSSSAPSQLLQQLITPTPQAAAGSGKLVGHMGGQDLDHQMINSGKWSSGGNSTTTANGSSNVLPQSSNSVLMNLLEPPQLLMDFEDSRDSLQDQCLNSPRSCAKQLRMARKLQSAGHHNNPLISGGNLSRSTNSTPTNDDPPPHLVTQPEVLWNVLRETMGDTFIKPPSPMCTTSIF